MDPPHIAGRCICQLVLDAFDDVLVTTAAASSPDITAPTAEDLRNVGIKLRELAEAGRTKEPISLVLSLLEQMRSENSQLAQQIHLLLRRACGRSGEKGERLPALPAV